MTAISRRDWFRLTAAGAVGSSVSGWLEALAAQTPAEPRRSCILLWMNGGPSQLDTFDLKPGHANGGPFRPIDTTAPGLRISEHLPQLAKHGQRLAVVRSMSTREADHGRGTYLMHTGQPPMGAIQYPTLGSLVAKERGDPTAELPAFVSIAPYRQFSPAAYGPGFLGPRFAPLLVGDSQPLVRQPNADDDGYRTALKVDDLAAPKDVAPDHGDARLTLLRQMQDEFAAVRPSPAAESHRSAYERAARLMRSAAGQAFDLDSEPAALRDAYGRNVFGQGCLLARRLVERGVPFVEVTLGGFANNALGWDTHLQNFDAVKRLSSVLDPAWATLMADLDQRGMLDETLIVWMGEFGRTPKINAQNGRDHYADAWSTVLAGGGIRGGQVVGKTTDDGMKVADRPVSVGDFLATVIQALGIDRETSNPSNVGRPIPIVDKSARPIEEVLA